MSSNRANIDSPEVIKDFRHRLIKFDEVARQAVAGSQNDVFRIAHWISHEQTSYWGGELRRREEQFLVAKIKYAQAKDPNSPYQKESSVDDKVEMEKCRRRRDEAEVKLKAVKKWTAQLERMCAEKLATVRVFGGKLEIFTPLALHKLDMMVERLEDYLRPMAPMEAPSAALPSAGG
jgi:hypothetical protein